jgi:beta-mannosidase
MLLQDWQLAKSEPDQYAGPPALPALAWQTLARAMPVAAARVGIGNPELDGHDWWYRTRFDPGPSARLVLDSVATVADVYLDGQLVAHSETMFRPIEVDLRASAQAAAGDRDGTRELAVCCRALAPRLARRRTPRARWRTGLVENGNLRFYRTMLLGRAPGFAPGPAAVGLCAPVHADRSMLTDGASLRGRIVGSDGVLSVIGAAAELDGTEVVAVGATGEHRGRVGEPLRIPDVARWWPHTHGEPNLYEVTVGGEPVGSVGFRTLSWPADWETSGFGLAVNDVDIFCRGAVWTPTALREPHADPGALAQRLGLVVAAGMNLLRIPGTATYESEAFHDLCDQLGILVWQDMMFANLDYPDGDRGFVAEVEAEAAFQIGRLTARPSFAVLCGGSECAQQVTMLGQDPELARGPLYTAILPAALAAAGGDAAYVPNAPWGGDIAFRPDTGVANYFGVGAYLRDISDARLANVAFATECLAFANVGDRDGLSGRGVPRDQGAGWDFADVRDHYLQQIYQVDAVQTRWSDPDRYLELCRTLTGELMGETFGLWRAGGSSTRGALVLWLADLEPGSGWGLLDDRGVPKAAFARLAQALAPRATWLTNEGLSGIDVHVANDGPAPLEGTLRVALYRNGEVCVECAELAIVLAGHGYVRHGVEELVGRFVDVSWAYRFGPPNQDLVVATLEGDGGLISQAFSFPVGRPLARQTPQALGLAAELTALSAQEATLTLRAHRVLHGVRIRADGWLARDDCLTLEPGHARTVPLRRVGESSELTVALSAVNLHGSVRVSAA